MRRCNGGWARHQRTLTIKQCVCSPYSSCPLYHHLNYHRLPLFRHAHAVVAGPLAYLDQRVLSTFTFATIALPSFNEQVQWWLGTPSAYLDQRAVLREVDAAFIAWAGAVPLFFVQVS